MLYLRAFRGKQAAGRELWAMTRSYLGRFFVAGLILVIPVLVVSSICAFVFHASSRANGVPRASYLQG